MESPQTCLAEGRELWGNPRYRCNAETAGAKKKKHTTHDLSEIAVMVVVFFPIYRSSAQGMPVLAKGTRVGAVL